MFDSPPRHSSVNSLRDSLRRALFLSARGERSRTIHPRGTIGFYLLGVHNCDMSFNPEGSDSPVADELGEIGSKWSRREAITFFALQAAATAAVLNKGDKKPQTEQIQFPKTNNESETGAEELRQVLERINLIRQHCGLRLGPISDSLAADGLEFSIAGRKRKETTLAEGPSHILVAELLTLPEYDKALASLTRVIEVLSPKLIQNTHLLQVNLCARLADCRSGASFASGEILPQTLSKTPKSEVVINLGLRDMWPDHPEEVDLTTRQSFLVFLAILSNLKPVFKIGKDKKFTRELDQNAVNAFYVMIVRPKAYLAEHNKNKDEITRILMGELERLSEGQMDEEYWKAMVRGRVNFGYWRKRFSTE